MVFFAENHKKVLQIKLFKQNKHVLDIHKYQEVSLGRRVYIRSWQEGAEAHAEMVQKGTKL